MRHIDQHGQDGTKGLSTLYDSMNVYMGAINNIIPFTCGIHYVK